MERAYGYARNYEVVPGVPIETVSQALITVYDAVTGILIPPTSVFDDNLPIPTVKGNPFLSSIYGEWYFYAADGRYSVRVSNDPGGLTLPVITPYTVGDISLGDVGLLGLFVVAGPDAPALVAAIAAAAVVDGTVYVRHGAYTWDADVTVPANVTLWMGAGALADIPPGRTLTINGPFEAGLTQVFSSASVVRFAVGSVEGVPPEWWYDGLGDYTAAITAAMGSVPVYSGMDILFQAGKIYDCASPLVDPAAGGDLRAVSFRGVGGAGATSKATIRFSAVGVGLKQFDFSSAANSYYIKLRNLVITHYDGLPSDTTHGIGLSLPNGAAYFDFEDVWIEYFDIGIYVGSVGGGSSIYAHMKNVQVTTCYTYGLRGNPALMNGDVFDACTFSRTVTGYGLYLLGLGAAVAFRSCYFEANAQGGAYIDTAYHVGFDTCYFENLGIDLTMRSVYASDGLLLQLNNCYFDLNLIANHYRVQLTKTRAFVSNCRFYNSKLAPPIHVINAGSTEPCIAINNEYDWPTLVDTTNEEGWFILDSKHPYVPALFTAPTARRSYKLGDFVYNRGDAATGIPNRFLLGWICTRAGRGSAVADPVALTGDTSIASANVPVNDSNYVVSAGDIIKIAGVAFGVGADPAVMVAQTAIIGGLPTFVLAEVCNQHVVGGAITYQTATFEEVFRAAKQTSNQGVAVASGANVQLAEIYIPDNTTMGLEVLGTMLEAAAPTLATSKLTTIVATAAGGVITFGAAVDIGTAIGSGGAYPYTVFAADGRANRCLVYVTQANGNPGKFGYTVRVADGIGNAVITT